MQLAASLLVQGGLAGTEDDARERAERALESGAAAERFALMAAALGGPADLMEHPERHLPQAPVTRPVDAEGVIAAVDCRAVGLVVTGLGGNRAREDDVIDPAVGLTRLAPIGAEVGPDRPLAIVHARDEAGAERAAEELLAAYTFGEAPEPAPAVAGRIE
jgi:thymidine phosphorylase